MERVAMSIDTSHDFGSPFEDWPLRSYEEEQMRQRDQLDKHRDHILLYGGLTLWGLLGAAFIISSTYISHGIVSEITRDIGIALLSAAVLGLTVHIWIESTVVRDVFRAAIGHVLPPELRDEVHWISSFKCISNSCVCSLEIEDLGCNVVKVTIEIERELRNITTKSQTIKECLHWMIGEYRKNVQKLSNTSIR
jgi:hypothetical protein